MHVEYTDHALERLRDRGISKRAIRDALIHGRTETQPDGSNKKTHPTRGKKLIVIYQRQAIDKYIIITAYYGN